MTAHVDAFAKDAVRAAVSAPGDIHAIEVLRHRMQVFQQAQFTLPFVEHVTALRYAVKVLLSRPSCLTSRLSVVLAASHVLDGFWDHDFDTLFPLCLSSAALAVARLEQGS